MKTIRFKTVLLAVGFVASIVLVSNVFAGKGYGRGYGNSEGNGNGRNCPGYGYQNSLSEEESAKLDSERMAFFESTSDLRRSIRQKGLELQSEFAKEEIDAAKARALQQELSELRAQLDAQRLDQRIKMKGAYPQGCDGQGRRQGRGMGRAGGCW